MLFLAQAEPKDMGAIAVPIIAGIFAVLAAFLAHRAWVRQEAWKLVFTKKYEALSSLIAAMDAVAGAATDTAKIQWIRRLPAAKQPQEIIGFMRTRWGKDFLSGRDPIPKLVYALMPPPGAVSDAIGRGDVTAAQELLKKQEGGITALLNLMQEEFHAAQGKIVEAKSALLLTVTEPGYVNAIIDAANTLFGEVFDKDSPDPDALSATISERFGPLYSEVRRELQRSARGLQGATRLTWRWKFSESNYHRRIQYRLTVLGIVGVPCFLFWTAALAYAISPPVHELGHLSAATVVGEKCSVRWRTRSASVGSTSTGRAPSRRTMRQAKASS